MESLTPELARVKLQVPRDSRLDDDLFFAICEANRDYRIERDANGDIQILPPTGPASPFVLAGSWLHWEPRETDSAELERQQH